MALDETETKRRISYLHWRNTDMIDLEKEPLLSLAQAARLLPRRRGKKVCATTVWRWCVHGHRGVLLEALRTPAGWATTAAAVGRFLAELARQDRQQKTRDPSQPLQSREWARAYLEANGIGKKGRGEEGTSPGTGPKD
jgi:hypothetical protein